MTVKQPQLTTQPLTDEFDSDEFAGEQSSYPYLIRLNTQTEVGFFIKIECLDQADWHGNVESKDYQFTTGEGEVYPGILLQEPRFLVLHRKPLFLVDRDTGDYKGDFDKKIYNPETMQAVNQWLVMFVDANGALGHSVPFQMTLKGSIGGTMPKKLQEFRGKCNQAYSKVHGKPNKPKGDKFHALCIFKPLLVPELSGDKKKSWAMVCKGFATPSEETWGRMFLGYNEEVKAQVFELFDSTKAYSESPESQPQDQPETEAKSEKPDYYAGDIPF